MMDSKTVWYVRFWVTVFTVGAAFVVPGIMFQEWWAVAVGIIPMVVGGVAFYRTMMSFAVETLIDA